MSDQPQERNDPNSLQRAQVAERLAWLLKAVAEKHGIIVEVKAQEKPQ